MSAIVPGDPQEVGFHLFEGVEVGFMQTVVIDAWCLFQPDGYFGYDFAAVNFSTGG